ncbi:MAG: hypothetical protein ACRDXB_17140 [Actinomycetes bacterium]
MATPVRAAVRTALDSVKRDWVAYQRQAEDFHLRNVRAWAGNRTDVDLAAQVDPDFVPDPRRRGSGSVIVTTGTAR